MIQKVQSVSKGIIYDNNNRKNFNILDDINAEPAINGIRKKGRKEGRMHLPDPSKGCPLRRDQVLLIKKKLRYDGCMESS